MKPNYRVVYDGVQSDFSTQETAIIYAKYQVRTRSNPLAEIYEVAPRGGPHTGVTIRLIYTVIREARLHPVRS